LYCVLPLSQKTPTPLDVTTNRTLPLARYPDTEFTEYPALLLHFLKKKIKENIYSSHIDLLI